MRKKLKYQGGITKLLCMKLAEWNKKRFRKDILKSNRLPAFKIDKVNFDMISFSGAASFEDQFLSIYSFVYYAGIPLSWTIYSDKSYNKEHKDIFRTKFPFVSIIDWDIYDYSGNKLLGDYLSVCHLAKKLNVITSHNYQRQTLYLDSDIVFYKNISTYLNSKLLDKGFWYASDTMWGNVSKHFSIERESIYPLNSGLLILNNEFNMELIFRYLESLKGEYQYFSEQLSFEYAFRKQSGKILDPRQFIIDTGDQFDFSSKYIPDTMAMRHYTGPVRHKLWQYGWHWHFRNNND